MDSINIKIEELACMILGIEYDIFERDKNKEEKIEQILIDRMNIDLETLYSVIKRILPLIREDKDFFEGIFHKGLVKRIDNETEQWVALLITKEKSLENYYEKK